MISGRRVVALIPARAGSKRLPNKNILNLANKPLIAWSITAAKESQYIDDIVVSSDSEEILRIAKEFNASVVLPRPVELASDTATTNDVVLHAIDALKLEADSVIIILQPTSPLRTHGDIDSSLELMFAKALNGVISVSPCEHPPLWSNTLSEDLLMEDFIKPEIKGLRSQDLPQFYRLNGAIYAFEVSKLVQKNGIFIDKNVCAYIMDRRSSVDIDELLDFKLAELLIQLND